MPRYPIRVSYTPEAWATRGDKVDRGSSREWHRLSRAEPPWVVSPPRPSRPNGVLTERGGGDGSDALT